MLTTFPHRTNWDRTVDSVCPRCYVTIGTAHQETDLEQMEADHICDPARLALYEDSLRWSAKRPRGIASSQNAPAIKRAS
jgi:hypothetical protein